MKVIVYNDVAHTGIKHPNQKWI